MGLLRSTTDPQSRRPRVHKRSFTPPERTGGERLTLSYVVVFFSILIFIVSYSLFAGKSCVTGAWSFTRNITTFSSTKKVSRQRRAGPEERGRGGRRPWRGRVDGDVGVGGWVNGVGRTGAVKRRCQERSGRPAKTRVSARNSRCPRCLSDRKTGRAIQFVRPRPEAVDGARRASGRRRERAGPDGTGDSRARATRDRKTVVNIVRCSPTVDPRIILRIFRNY